MPFDRSRRVAFVHALIAAFLLLPQLALAAGLPPAGGARQTASSRPPAAGAEAGPASAGPTVAGLAYGPAPAPDGARGRVLLSPTMDADGDAATNPTADRPVPVIDLLGEQSGSVVLGAQLASLDSSHEPIGTPVTFRIWNDAGDERVESVRADAWGAAGLKLFFSDLAAAYAYQVTAAGYDPSEIRRFRFDDAQVGLAVRAAAATLSVWQSGQRLVFTVRSPLPMVAERDQPTLLIARKDDDPDAGSGRPNTPGIKPLPRLPMQLVDANTAQVEVNLPEGSYGAVASITLDGPNFVSLTSQAEAFTVVEASGLPLAPARWLSEPDFVPGRTLVQVQTSPGVISFALVANDAAPAVEDAWLEDSRLIRAWRTGPFEWQREIYKIDLDLLVDDGKKKVSLTGFDYDPMLRRYTFGIDLLLDHPVSDTLHVDVLGPGGVVIKRESARVVLQPDATLTYAIDVPAELGKPTGLKVVLEDPLEAVITATSEQDKGLLYRAINLLGDNVVGLVAAVVNYGSLRQQTSLFVDALSLKILEVKLLIEVPGMPENPLTFKWFPDGGSTLDAINAVKSWALSSGWNWSELQLDLGGANFEWTLSAGMTIRLNEGQCPDADAKDSMERSLRLVAESINAGFEALGTEQEDDDPSETPAVPLFWIVSLIGQIGDPQIGGSASADDLTLRISAEFSFTAGLRIVADLWPFDSIFFGAKKLKENLAFIYNLVTIEQAALTLIVNGRQFLNGQLKQADCTPAFPDLKPPDDRQDAFQGLEQFFQGDSPEATIANLNPWLSLAAQQGQWRAERYLVRALRQAELQAFNNDLEALDAYLEEAEDIMRQAAQDEHDMFDGVLPISPTLTITEALGARIDQALADVETLDYPRRQQLLHDAVAVADRDYFALFGQELELQHELRDLFFGNAIGVTATGFADATLSALYRIGLPFQMVSLWPGGEQYRGYMAPYVAPEVAPKVLVVPAGGLSTVARSPEATAWLDAYVANGGLLIVFTQAFGADWLALPGGQVRGVGYAEDQRCQLASVRAAMPSDWLVWMGVETPDVQVDGTFTAWPDNANLLLTRTYGNFPNYPAMIEYAYGAGTVLATSAYGDWASFTGLGWGDDWQMTRTILLRAYLLAQGQDLDDVPSFPPSTSFTLSLPITNTTSLTTTEIQIGFDSFRNYPGASDTIPVTLNPGAGTTITPTLKTPPAAPRVHKWTERGLFHLEQLVTTEGGQTHFNWSRIVRVTGGPTPPDISVMLIANPVAVDAFTTQVVTATVRNFTASPLPVRLVGTQELVNAPVFSGTVPAFGRLEHTYSVYVDRTRSLGVQLRDDTTDDVLGDVQMSLYLAQPYAQMGLTLAGELGEGSPLQVNLRNEPAYHWNQARTIYTPTITLELSDAANTLAWTQSQTLPNQAAGAVLTATFAATLPAPLTLGSYRLYYQADDAFGQRAGYGWTTAPAALAVDVDLDRSTLRIRESGTLTVSLTNNGHFSLTPTLTVDAPELGLAVSQAVAVPFGATVHVPLSYTVPATMTAGSYLVRATATQGGAIDGYGGYTVPPADIVPALVSGPAQAGGILRLRLHNVGGVDSPADLLFHLADATGRLVADASATGLPVQAGEVVTVTLPVPAGALAGTYRLDVNAHSLVGGRQHDFQRLLVVTGQVVDTTVATDRRDYLEGETAILTGSLTASPGPITGVLTLTVRQAGVGPQETVLGATPNEQVNDSLERGFLDADEPDVVVGPDGTVHALWYSWRINRVFYARRDPGGAWSAPEIVSDNLNYGRGNPSIALGGDGTVYAIWWDNRFIGSEGSSIYFAQRAPTGGWSANIKVNDFLFGYAYDPDIAVDAAGNLYAVWHEDGNRYGIFFSQRPVGGVWGASEQVQDVTNELARQPSIAVDAAGNVHVAWTSAFNPNKLTYDVRPAGGTWGTDEMVASVSYISEGVAVLLLPGDAPALVWSDSRVGGTDYDIYYADRSGGAWGSAVKISDAAVGSVQTDPAAAVDAAGTVYAAWRDERDGGGQAIYFTSGSAAGGWAANERVSDPVNTYRDHAAMSLNAAGDLYVAWSDQRDTGNEHEAMGNWRPVAGAFGADEYLSTLTGGAGQSFPALAYADDTLVALFADGAPGGPSIVADERAGGIWGPDTQVNDGPQFVNHDQPAVAADAAGNLYAVWQDRRSGLHDIRSSIRPAGGSWGPSNLVNDVTTNVQQRPSLAVSPDGTAHAIWEDNRTIGTYHIYASVLPPGGAWAASVKVNDDASTNWHGAADIAVDAAGNAYAVWADGRNGNVDIYFSYRPTGGTWGLNVRVNDDAGSASQSEPAIFVSPGGRAYAVWQDNRGGNNDIYFAERPPGGAWGANQALVSTLGSQTLADITGDGAGSLLVAYVEGGVVYALVRRDGVWSLPARVSNPSLTAPGTEPPPEYPWSRPPIGGQEPHPRRGIEGPARAPEGAPDGGPGNGGAIQAETASNPAVAWGPNDELAVAWNDQRNGVADDLFVAFVIPTLLPAAGPWTDERALSDDAPGNSNWQWDVDLVVDGLGKRYAVWSDDRSSGTGPWLATAEPGEAWSANEPAGDQPGGAYAWDHALAVTPGGKAFVVWEDNRSGPWAIYLRSRDADGSWAPSEPVDDGGGGGQFLADVIADAAGNAYVAWQDNRDDSGDIYFRERSAAGAWGAPVRLNDDAGSAGQADPNVAVDAAGAVYVVWDDGRSGGDWDVFFAERPAGGAWSANERVDDDPGNGEQWYPRLVVDPAGNAYAVWMDDRNGDWDVYFARRPAGGAWSANERVNDDSSGAMQMLPNLALDGAGNVTVVWKDDREGTFQVYGARRSADGRWSRNLRVNRTGETIGDYYYRLGVAAHTSGDLTVAWDDYGNGIDTDIRSAAWVMPGLASLWSEPYSVTETVSQTVSSPFGPPYTRPGKYWLGGSLTTDLGQTTDAAQRSFYVYPPGVALSLDVEPAIVRPGATVTVTGRITNTALLADSFDLRLLAGGDELLNSAFALAPGEGQSFTATLQPATSRAIQALVADPALAIGEWVEVSPPGIAASLAAPALAGTAPITAQLWLTNTGLVPADVIASVAGSPPAPVALAPGDVVALAYPVAIAGDTMLHATLAGDVVQTLTRTVAFAAGASLVLSPPPTLTSGANAFGYELVGAGSLPTELAMFVRLDGQAILTAPLTLLPGETLSGTIVLDVPAGAHQLAVLLLGRGDQPLDEATISLAVLPAGSPVTANVQIAAIHVVPPAGASPVGSSGRGGRRAAPIVAAGATLQVDVDVTNDGAAVPVIAAMGAFGIERQRMITPTSFLTSTFRFTETVPVDMPAGIYLGHVVVDSQRRPFTVTVAGVSLDMALALDKTTHAPGEPITLTVTLTETGGLTSTVRLALDDMGPGDYVTLTVPAAGVLQHTFVFSAAESGRVAVGLSMASPGEVPGQRTIMIDSLPVAIADAAAPVSLRFDRPTYDAGDTIWMDVTVNGPFSFLSLMGPMELQRDEWLKIWNLPITSTLFYGVLTGTYSLSYTLPVDLRTGRYSFLLSDSRESRRYAVDVHGWDVFVDEARMNQVRYATTDRLAATVDFLNEGSAALVDLRLRAWLAPADGSALRELTPVVSRTVTLAPGTNRFTIEGAFAGLPPGPTRLMINLMSPDGAWRVAGALAQFDVGAAHLVELALDHGSYELDAPAAGRLTLYGFGPTHVVITSTSGITLLQTTVDPSGFATLPFTAPTGAFSDYLVLARSVGADGAVDRRLLAYNVPDLPDSVPPTLTLTSPTTRTVIYQAAPLDLSVTGQVGDDSGQVVLLLNGVVVTPTALGAFTATLPLTRGLNVVSAVARDARGNVTYAPAVPVFVVGEHSGALTGPVGPVYVNQSIAFSALLTSTESLPNAGFILNLPAGVFTDVVVMASGGLNRAGLAGIQPAQWFGPLSPGAPVSLNISARPIQTGTYTLTATLFWGWGTRSESSPIQVEVLPGDPTSLKLVEAGFPRPARPGPIARMLWGAFGLLLLATAETYRRQRAARDPGHGAALGGNPPGTARAGRPADYTGPSSSR